MSTPQNRLVTETSPYLLQHADNPVEWYPWSSEALAKAREEDKPILLSIGYSACHWCHVMAHESFEDPATAEILNLRFVNIKVDREERPDIDKIYQVAYQMLMRRGGGWPLTMFLAPDTLAPFYGGTYFPRTARYGLPAFAELLEGVSNYFRDHRSEVIAHNAELIDAFIELEPDAINEEERLSAAPLDMARHQLEHAFDERHGGFGGAPKFPQPSNIERLLRHWSASGGSDERALYMAIVTLTKMSEGGIYDHLGGGFCRYSVDDHWTIPHFEKMLYDNAQLLPLYAAAWSATGEALFERVALETGEWALREMEAPGGGFFSTLDADSDGEEGKFYVWRPEEVKRLLAESDYPVFAARYGLDRPANFEDCWHLRITAGLEEVARSSRLPGEEVTRRLDSARATLRAARDSRLRPARDEKILTAWNGLMIKGLAVAGRRLTRPEFIAAATRAVDFIAANQWRDGRLLACYKDGRARFAAYLDDYAFLLEGLFELLQARWRDADLAFAIQLAETLLRHFEDHARGSFYFTADDHEHLIHRPKPLGDDALPSGNGTAAVTLARLGHLTGEHRFIEAAERTLRVAWSAIVQLPYAHNTLLSALEELLSPPQIIIVRGRPPDIDAWRNACQEGLATRRIVVAIPHDARDLPEALAARRAPEQGVAAYVCRGTQCTAPINSLAELSLILDD
jgi:uncharacterized protein YyaL (SSP411 family)